MKTTKARDSLSFFQAMSRACGRTQPLGLFAALVFLSARFSLRDLDAAVFEVDFFGDLSAMVSSLGSGARMAPRVP